MKPLQFVGAALLVPVSLSAQPAQSSLHPLDGRGTAEYWTVYDALQSAGHMTPETKFTSVLLHPPEKSVVLAWRPVTPYAAAERYAAGTYPTGSEGNDGLAAWTQANRKIANTDIVGWYTLGFHHVTRAEDWPVMPVMWHEFTIRPFHFFQKNPVLDLPKSLGGQ